MLLGQLKRIPLRMVHALNMSLYALRRHPASDGLIPKGILSLYLVNNYVEIEQLNNVHFFGHDYLITNNKHPA